MFLEVYALIFTMTFCGLLLIFRVDQQRESESQLRLLERAEKRDLIINRKPGFIAKQRQRLSALLRVSQVQPFIFITLCFFSFLLGTFAGGFFLGDSLLGLLLGVAALPLPLIYILMQARRFMKRESEQIEELMSSVTGAYIATNSIITAFESYNNLRLKGMDPLLRRIGPIDEFLIDVHAINPSVDNALRRLQAKLNNRYFDDWVNMLILCQQNKEMRFALQPIIKAFNDSKLAQLEADTVTGLVWREYFLVLCMLFGLFPVLRLSNEVWFNILTQTFIGRILVCIMLVAALGTAFYVMKVTRPID